MVNAKLIVHCIQHRLVPSCTAISLATVMWAAPWTRHLRAEPSPQSSGMPVSAPTEAQAVLQRYCVTCHNEGMKQRGAVPIALDTLDLSNLGRDAETWEKVVRKVRTGLMPPPGRPRPDKATHDGFAAWLETGLDRVAATNPNPGRTEPFHRLNRTEYQNVIRDLLHLRRRTSSRCCRPTMPATDSTTSPAC